MLKFGSPRKDEPPAKAEPAVEPPIARAPVLVPDAPRVEGPQMPMSSVNNVESILAAGLTIGVDPLVAKAPAVKLLGDQHRHVALAGLRGALTARRAP